MEKINLSSANHTGLLPYIFSLMIVLSCEAAPTKNIPTEVETPKLTVVMVIDQFAHHYIPKLKKNFNFGLKKLLTKGVYFKEARYSYGQPKTSPGHTTLSTGVTPKDHGIVGNKWFNTEGEKVKSTEDASSNAGIFHNGELLNPGASNHYSMVDGLSDQFMRAGNESTPHKVFALSSKDKAALGLANSLGKPIWFHHTTGQYTSSKRYFEELPKWVTDFNKRKKLDSLTSVTWKSAYPAMGDYYKFPFINNYDYAAFSFKMVDAQPLPIDHSTKDPYNLFLKTPHADKLLFSLAKTCLKENLDRQSPDKMILWVSLSSLDLVGHYYGPDSKEAIDLLYHLDKNMKNFMDFTKKKYGAENVLFVLTSDHGVQPIPEIFYKKGYSKSRRIMVDTLMEKLNKHVQKTWGIEKFVTGFEGSSFMINAKIKSSTDPIRLSHIMNDLIDLLHEEPGIKHVWTRNELYQATFEPDSHEQFYKNQLYKNRDGDLICMTHPYAQLTSYPTGTSHCSPYDYDTHVPLIFYQKGKQERKQVNKKVWMTQVAPTLASLLGITRPSASTAEVLPDIKYPETQNS